MSKASTIDIVDGVQRAIDNRGFSQEGTLLNPWLYKIIRIMKRES